MSIAFVSCKDEKVQDLVSYNMEGYAQKGPFLSGGNVTIIELDNALIPTGKTYLSTIEDNTGKFSIPNVQFASSYVKLEVKGRYYDEVNGSVPMDELTLHSIVDLSTTLKGNVNILTHLVQSRIFNLVGGGHTYKNAKVQAEKEVLRIFNLDTYNANMSDTMNLVTSNISGGILLLISSIIQSNVASGMTFQEYITNLQTDFKSDGVINSVKLQNSLKTSARVLNINQIKENLANRYNEMGLSYDFYDLRPILKHFINTINYPSFFDGIFPVAIMNSVNLISEEDTVFIDKNSQYSIAVNCPVNNGFSNIFISITSEDIITTSNVNWYYPMSPKTRVLFKDMTNNTDLLIPISFVGSGQLTLNLHLLIGGKAVDYPTKTIIWK